MSLNDELGTKEQKKRKEIAAHTRAMILNQLNVHDEDENSIMTDYRNYYLQISFSELHPLMVFCLAKGLKSPSTAKQKQMTNELTLKVFSAATPSMMKLAAILIGQLIGLMKNLPPRAFLKFLTAV